MFWPKTVKRNGFKTDFKNYRSGSLKKQTNKKTLKVSFYCMAVREGGNIAETFFMFTRLTLRCPLALRSHLAIVDHEITLYTSGDGMTISRNDISLLREGLSTERFYVCKITSDFFHSG